MGRNTDDLPPDPDDPGWGEWVEQIIQDTGYDPELAKDMASDAYRVRDGDMSAEDFQDRYHEDVLDEFGRDMRPTGDSSQPGVPEGDEELPGIPSAMSDADSDGESRRSVLKKAGGAAALALSLPAGVDTVSEMTTMTATGDEVASAVESALSDQTGSQLGMVIDLQRCQGALDCMEGCKEENNTSEGVHWNYVFHYTEPDQFLSQTEEESDGEEEPQLEYMPRTCQHCSRPTCTYVCPTEARFKREEDGLVLTDYDTCIGCRYCQVACPYGVNHFSWGEPTHSEEFEYDRQSRNGNTVAGNPPGGNMGKCTFCVQRQDSGDSELEGTTACEQACPWGVYSFGDLTDPEDDPQQHLKEKEGEQTFLLLEEVGNGPNVIYIGEEPSLNAEQTGLEALEERGFVVNRREVLGDLVQESGGGSHE